MRVRRALRLVVAVFGLAGFAMAVAVAQEVTDLRGAVPLTEEVAPPPIYKEINDDKRRARNYPEQPPVIPHNIRDYPVTLNANKCLTCHTREFTAESQAPMISITHFVDREGQTLLTVTPRRYFCTQCHVTQSEAPDLVENQFMPIDEILRAFRKKNNGSGGDSGSDSGTGESGEENP